MEAALGLERVKHLMVDFRKLRADKPHVTTTDPIEIFRRLPKPQGINDLYTSQDEVLKEWHRRWQNNKNKKGQQHDFVIKLHTGGGKTLVGLLIAQSIMNETHGPVIYVTPTNQLVEQILDKAKTYNIPAVAYDTSTRGMFPDTFHNGTSVLICNYQALFNGRSRFGTRWKPGIIRPEGIILDDAHTAFSTIRDDIFTLKVKKDINPEDYIHLTSIFRSDFEEVGKIGTFEDIVSGKSSNDNGVLEVPYWSWKQKSTQVHNYLSPKGDLHPYLYVWPHLRDAFDYCYCLISSSAFVITPISPIIDAIPTFHDCKNRIYMSATIGDDSALIRTFGTTPTAVAHPIISSSLAGISERMILIPERTQIPQDSINTVLQHLVMSISEERNAGIIILVPSFASAQLWEDVAKIADKEMVLSCVKSLQEGKSLGPFVFANRYDGMDLAGDSCRLLIMAGLPMGASEYDIFRNSIFANTATISYELAQRIEQGMGRGARGPNDYCVVIATGKDLVDYLNRDSNKQLLTSSTRAQLLIGEDASHHVENEEQLKKTILLCLNRDDGWREYHADRLATLTRSNEMSQDQIKLASAEAKAFKQFRTGLFDEAITGLSQFIEKTETLDQRYRGWLQQFVAHIAYYWGDKDLAWKYQRQAHMNNNHLHRPKAISPYNPVSIKSKQAEAIIDNIVERRSFKGFLPHFEAVAAMLTSSVSANQFEEALKDFGVILGFRSERPEKQYEIGPDVLWILDNDTGLIIEAKSRKVSKNPLTKDEHGQLLNSEVWFKKEYPNYQCIRVSVHPNNFVTRQTPTDSTRVLTLQKLDEMIIAARSLFESLCAIELAKDSLVTRCNTLLDDLELNAADIIKNYLLPFTPEE